MFEKSRQVLIGGFSLLVMACLLVLTSGLVISPALAQKAAKQAARENVMLILDASGSMWGRVDGRPKIEIAREVIGNVLREVGPGTRMGVMAYGHRSKGDCKDIQTVIPVGPVNAPAYMSVIGKLSPKGKTPISDAVTAAARALKFTEEKATVVLVSDGLETCDANPCALAAALEKQGIDFTVHVVGFDLQDKDTSSLKCLADKTGGKYLAADDTGSLADALGETVAEVQAPAPKSAPAGPAPVRLKVDVLYAEGVPAKRAYVYVIPKSANRDRRKAVRTGSSARIFKVPPGQYDLEATLGRARGVAVAEVKPSGLTTAKIVLNAGLLKVQALPKEGGKPLPQAYIYVREAKQGPAGKRKSVTAGNQRNLFTLPAGSYYVIAQLGKARVGKDITIEAGKRNDVTLVLASGLLKVEVLAEEGGKPLKEGYIYIDEAKAGLDGKRKRVTAGNQRTQFSLPAGRYFVTAQVGKARLSREIEVAAGKFNEASFVIGLGVLKVTGIPAQGAKPLKGAYVRIYEAEAGLDGKRKSITAGSHRNQFKLAAGKYHITVTAGKARVARDIEVKAGKRAEIIVNLEAGSLKVDADKGVYLRIYSAEKNLDGSRDQIAAGRSNRPFILKAGKYVVVGTVKKKSAEVPVEVKAGKLTETSLKIE